MNNDWRDFESKRELLHGVFNPYVHILYIDFEVSEELGFLVDGHILFWVSLLSWIISQQLFKVLKLGLLVLLVIVDDGLFFPLRDFSHFKHHENLLDINFNFRHPIAY